VPCNYVGLLHGLSQSEIAELGIELEIHDDVHALQVTVHKRRRLAVKETHSLGDLRRDLEPLHKLQRELSLMQSLVQRPVGHELCDYH